MKAVPEPPGDILTAEQAEELDAVSSAMWPDDAVKVP